jgi:hypothetical protein
MVLHIYRACPMVLPFQRTKRRSWEDRIFGLEVSVEGCSRAHTLEVLSLSPTQTTNLFGATLNKQILTSLPDKTGL